MLYRISHTLFVPTKKSFGFVCFSRWFFKFQLIKNKNCPQQPCFRWIIRKLGILDEDLKNTISVGLGSNQPNSLIKKCNVNYKSRQKTDRCKVYATAPMTFSDQVSKKKKKKKKKIKSYIKILCLIKLHNINI